MRVAPKSYVQGLRAFEDAASLPELQNATRRYTAASALNLKWTILTIKRYLDGYGRPWTAYVLIDAVQPAVRSVEGRLSAIRIEDDSLYEAVKSFLLRMGQVEQIGS